MNDNSLKLPKFKYHPNVYDKEKVLDAVQFDNNVCQCCGNKTDVYVSTMYCSGEVDCICMECVANGKAAEKYDGEFIQYAEEISDEEKRTELFRRTPGYCSWQGEYWLACCDNYCEYLGDVGYAELKEMNLVSIIEEYKKVEGMDFDNEMLEKGGSLAGYLFRCIHCGKFRLNVDCD